MKLINEKCLPWMYEFEYHWMVSSPNLKNKINV